MKFKKNDEIIVTLGKDKGKHGKIEAVYPSEQEILVGGINMFKKHKKPQGQGNPGGIIDITRPLSVAKVAVVCPHCSKPTRIGFEKKGSEKIRVCRKCGGII